MRAEPMEKFIFGKSHMGGRTPQLEGIAGPAMSFSKRVPRGARVKPTGTRPVAREGAMPHGIASRVDVGLRLRHKARPPRKKSAAEFGSRGRRWYDVGSASPPALRTWWSSRLAERRGGGEGGLFIEPCRFPGRPLVARGIGRACGARTARRRGAEKLLSNNEQPRGRTSKHGPDTSQGRIWHASA